MVASAPCTSSVLRALSMQVWPAASSGWPTAWLGPADLDSAGFSAVGRSSWVFGREPYFAKYSSLVAQREKLRGSIGSSLAVFFVFVFLLLAPSVGRLSFLSLSPMNQ